MRGELRGVLLGTKTRNLRVELNWIGLDGNKSRGGMCIAAEIGV